MRERLFGSSGVESCSKVLKAGIYIFINISL